MMLRRQGTTFIELVIVVSILAIVFSVALNALVVGDSAWRLEMGYTILQQNLRLAMERISRELRQAQNSTITITNGGKNISFSHIAGNHSISYYLDSQGQIIRSYNGTNYIVAQFIQNINFSHSNDVVTVSITGLKNIKGRPITFSLVEKIQVRND